MKKLKEKLKSLNLFKLETVLTGMLLFVVSSGIATRCAFPILHSEVEMPEEFIDMLEN